MGSIISARCEACGQDWRVTIGGGMATFTTRSLWPVACKACRTLRHANITREPLTCETCGSEDVEIFGVRRDRTTARREPTPYPVATWGEFELPEQPYPCPCCGEHALHFNGMAEVMFD